MDPLAGIVAKMDRGMHHLKVVERGIACFLNDKSWEITFEDYPKPPTEMSFYVTDPTLAERGSPVPDDWALARFRIYREPSLTLSVRVGEVFGQFASSLDHLMTELVRLRSKRYRNHPEESPNFPIYENPGSFWRANPETSKVPAESISSKVRGKHFAELERLQPKDVKDFQYIGKSLSDARVLAIVKTVNNFHKHATLRPSIVGLQRMTMKANPNIVAFAPLYVPGAPLDDKTPLYAAVFRAGPKMGVPMVIEPTLSFGVRGHPWVSIRTMRECGERVSEIIGRFRAITPEFQIIHRAPPGSSSE